MKLQSFLLADAVAAGAEGKVFIHGAGVNSISASEFPWSQPQLGVFANLEREDEPPGSDHAFRLDFVSHGSDEPLEAVIEANIRLPSEADDGSAMYVNLVATFNGIVFPERGRYWARVSLDGKELGRVPMQIGGPKPKLVRSSDLEDKPSPEEP